MLSGIRGLFSRRQSSPLSVQNGRKSQTLPREFVPDSINQELTEALEKKEGFSFQLPYDSINLRRQTDELHLMVGGTGDFPFDCTPHNFAPAAESNSMFCDLCGEPLLLSADPMVSCKDCNLMAHYKCSLNTHSFCDQFARKTFLDNLTKTTSLEASADLDDQQLSTLRDDTLICSLQDVHVQGKPRRKLKPLAQSSRPKLFMRSISAPRPNHNVSNFSLFEPEDAPLDGSSSVPFREEDPLVTSTDTVISTDTETVPSDRHSPLERSASSLLSDSVPSLRVKKRALRRSTTIYSTDYANYPISSLDRNSCLLKFRHLDASEALQKEEPIYDIVAPSRSSPPRHSVCPSSVMQQTLRVVEQGPLEPSLYCANPCLVAIGPRGPSAATSTWVSARLHQLVTLLGETEYADELRPSCDMVDGATVRGKLRVHMNLLRPVKLSQNAAEHELDFVSTNSEPLTPPDAALFRVPRGSSRIIHVDLYVHLLLPSSPFPSFTTISNMTALDVIMALLKRFSIENNVQKFALYEHTIENANEVAVRRLFDDESPFGLVLRWADLSHNDAATLERTLRSKRIVLQENETGDIVWEHFSPAELNTFLGLLHREENDYRQRIQLKFEAAKREILRLMKERWEASPELQKRVPKNSLPWECDSSERATKVASKFNLDAVVDQPVTGNAVVTPTGTLLSRSSWGSFDPRYDSVEDLRTATNDQSADADAESTDPWQRRKELAGTLPSRLVTKNDKEKVRKKKNSPADGLKQKEASSSAAPVRRRGLFSRKK